MKRPSPILLPQVLFALFAVLFLSVGGAAAQGATGIVAVVNDRIITNYDITQRILIIKISGQTQDIAGREKLIRDRAIGQLIEERLQEYEGVRQKIKVDDIDMRRAHNLVEKNIRIKPGSLAEFLKSNGIDPVSFDEKLRAEIVWDKIIRNKILPKIDIPEGDIDAELKKLAATGGSAGARGPAQKLLQVRFDYGNNPSDEFRAKALKNATALSQSNASCNNLAAAAPGYPGSHTSELGDIKVEDLKDRMQKAIRATPEGKLTAPIMTEQGVALLMLCPRNVKVGELPNRAEIKLILSRERINRRSKRYLRELRRGAIIERR